jgi:hypothetical protein
MAGRPSTLPCSRKKLSDSWETPGAAIFMDRELKTSIGRSRRTCASPKPNHSNSWAEAFNAFNRAQFYGPAAVDGQREDPSFGQIESAAAPRLMQIAEKFTF